MTAKKFISSWHKVFNSQNIDNLDDVLADEAVFTSPVVFKPMEGKEISKLYLYAAGQSFNMEKFSYVREVNDGLHSILEFETYIDDVSVNGVDMIEWNEEGKIIDFKVMIRPLKAVHKVQEQMIDSLNKFK